MAEVTVSEFATDVGVPVDRILDQLVEAGLSKKKADDVISDSEKSELLAFLRKKHGKGDSSDAKKITLRRKTVSELKVNVAGQGRSKPTSKTVNVEFRKKRTYAKRSDLAEEAKQEEEAKAAKLAEEKAAIEAEEAKKRAEEEAERLAEEKAAAEAKALEEAQKEAAQKAAEEKQAVETPTEPAVKVPAEPVKAAPAEPKKSPAKEKKRTYTTWSRRITCCLQRIW